jgi:hypothetical protein
MAIVVSNDVPDTYIEVNPASVPDDIGIRLSDYLYKEGVFILDEDKSVSLLRKQQEAKVYRNRLLALSDWTQVPDAPVDKAAWAEYRQALRDIPSQEGFPHSVVWPDKP